MGKALQPLSGLDVLVRDDAADIRADTGTVEAERARTADRDTTVESQTRQARCARRDQHRGAVGHDGAAGAILDVGMSPDRYGRNVPAQRTPRLHTGFLTNGHVPGHESPRGDER